MAYFFVAYLGIVRRKEWPHFFRFHVVMGMLLEIALQVIGTVSRWMPLAFYWGKVGMHFWTAVAFAYLFTVLESIRCALAVYLLYSYPGNQRFHVMFVILKDSKSKEKELASWEADLKRREKDIKRREDAVAKGGVPNDNRNWPPFFPIIQNS
ncbi:hypothetical protein CMV_024859 [Castanea mollissima]|uniref:Protein TIC 20 n=1 Tax=Castanea mollissima TaxID=60419 RepID=A0A8J4QDL0_9ROSI|nr:hypothetical protein CMV_024859 [Castanea mollissima]